MGTCALIWSSYPLALPPTMAMAEAAQLWLAMEYTGYIPEPASLPAPSSDLAGKYGIIAISF